MTEKFQAYKWMQWSSVCALQTATLSTLQTRQLLKHFSTIHILDHSLGSWNEKLVNLHTFVECAIFHAEALTATFFLTYNNSKMHGLQADLLVHTFNISDTFFLTISSYTGGILLTKKDVGAWLHSSSKCLNRAPFEARFSKFHAMIDFLSKRTFSKSSSFLALGYVMDCCRSWCSLL